MPKINDYETLIKEGGLKRDFIDKHSPFIHTNNQVKAGEPLEVKVQVGNEVAHPDDFDHYVSTISLYNKEVKLAEATFFAGTLGGQGKTGKQTATFNVVLEKDAVLTAQAYCTKHGIWQSQSVEVKVG